MLFNQLENEQVSITGTFACIWKPQSSTLKVAILKPQHQLPNLVEMMGFKEEETDMNLEFKSIQLDGEDKARQLIGIGKDILLVLTESNRIAYISNIQQNAILSYSEEFEKYPVEKLFESSSMGRKFVFSSAATKGKLFGCDTIRDVKKGEYVYHFEIHPIEHWVDTSVLPEFTVNDIGTIRLESFNINTLDGLSGHCGMLFLKNSGKCFIWGFRAYSMFNEKLSQIIDDEISPKEYKLQTIEAVRAVKERLEKKNNNWKTPFELNIPPLKECILNNSSGIGITVDNYVWFFGHSVFSLGELSDPECYLLIPPVSVDAPVKVQGGDDSRKLFVHPSGNLLLSMKDHSFYKWTEQTINLPGGKYVHIPVDIDRKISDVISIDRDATWGVDGDSSLYLLVDGPASITTIPVPIVYS